MDLESMKTGATGEPPGKKWSPMTHQDTEPLSRNRFFEGRKP